MSISAEKFIRQPLARQLGALAANLARIASCARWEKPGEAIEPMLSESTRFIEWIAPQAEIEVAAELADMQIMLGLWRKSWPRAREDRAQSILLSLQAQKWSEQVLDYSGLLQTEA